jgi:hypothetical protein
MKETRNILGWLGMAEKHSVLVDAQTHVEETCQTVSGLATAAEALESITDRIETASDLIKVLVVKSR